MLVIVAGERLSGGLVIQLLGRRVMRLCPDLFCRVMNRHTEQQLLNFCVAQHGRFNADAWGQLEGVAPEQKACAMLLLANARWYGRLSELRDLVGKSFSSNEAELTKLSHRAGFNPARFAQRLQGLLWQSTESKR